MSVRGRAVGRQVARRGCAGSWLVLLVAVAPTLIAVAPAPGFEAGAPGTLDRRGLPPRRLGWLSSARPLAPRLLGVELDFAYAAHAASAARSPDSLVAGLAGASARRWGVALAYGLPYGLSLGARLDGWNLTPGAGRFPGRPGSGRGFGDLETEIAYAAGQRGRRLGVRLAAGLDWPTGSALRYEPSPGVQLSPFTAGAREPHVAASWRLRVSGPGTAAQVDVQAAGRYTWRAAPPGPGEAFVPYPHRQPLLGLETGGRALDRLDLGLAISMSRGPAAVYAVLDWPLLLDADHLVRASEVPRTFTPGLRVEIGGRLALRTELAIQFASDHPATAFNPVDAHPEWGLRLGLATDLVPLDRDGDGDGIGDLRDRCPREPEDRDGYADRDGCPEPDNDLDGILDVADNCPQQREDFDGYEDGDGCPDPDNDQDGIADEVDDCPGAAEDADGFADSDGCPDPDNDQDGIADVDDACPGEPEDLDGVDDADGCPE